MPSLLPLRCLPSRRRECSSPWLSTLECPTPRATRVAVPCSRTRVLPKTSKYSVNTRLVTHANPTVLRTNTIHALHAADCARPCRVLPPSPCIRRLWLATAADPHLPTLISFSLNPARRGLPLAGAFLPLQEAIWHSNPRYRTREVAAATGASCTNPP